MANLADHLDAEATKHPDRPAVRLDDHMLSYGEPHAAASAVAGSQHDRGLEPGDLVGLVLPDGPAFALPLYGALLARGAAALGEEVGTAVVLAPDSTSTPEGIRELVEGRVAAYKYPRHVWSVDELPNRPTGKILHRKVHAPKAMP
jgi:acyl-CoA synthetase (AMP-forming)/AMP-acid ligase II